MSERLADYDSAAATPREWLHQQWHNAYPELPALSTLESSMRVLSIDDLGFSSKGGSLFMIYQQNKERLAQAGTSASLPALGLTGIP